MELLLKARIVPGCVEVAEGVVVDVTCAVCLAPDEWIVAARTNGCSVETLQYMNIWTWVGAKGVELFVEGVGCGESSVEWMRFVFDVDRSRLCPWMTVEVSPDQISIVIPIVKRVGRTVRADEAFSI